MPTQFASCTPPTVTQHDDAPLLLPPQPQTGRLTDCACADRPFDLAPRTRVPAVASQAYVQAADTFACELAGGYHLLMSPHALYGPSVVNAAGYRRWQTFAGSRPLIEPFDVQLAGELLIYPDARPPMPAAAPADQLTVWLHVTNACNLDCPYCYVRKSSHTLSAATGQAAIRTAAAAAAAHGMHALKIKYAGGEAALHFALVRELHAAALAAAATFNLALHEILLTNGTLISAAMAAWCLAENVKLMISIDGVGAAHDRLRPWRNGAGSFAQVEHSVDELLLPRGSASGHLDDGQWPQRPCCSWRRPLGAGGSWPALKL